LIVNFDKKLTVNCYSLPVTSISFLVMSVLLLWLQFALNPQVLPFYPQSLLSDSYFIKTSDSAGDFAWNLEQFCGISDDTAVCSTANKLGIASQADSRQSWDLLNGDFSASSHEQLLGSVNAVSRF